MPIYEYQCDACGHRFEMIQSIVGNPPSHCPQCDQAGVRKLISAAGFRLKGSGWYETDFKSANKRNVIDSGKDSSEASGDDAGSKTKEGNADKQSADDSQSKSSGSSSPKEDSSKSSTNSSSSGQS